MVHFDEISSDDENQEVETEDMQVVSDEEDENLDEGGENGENVASRVYLPNQENKETPLECDQSAYRCFHAVRTGFPCLSFDVIPDNLGDGRADQYPLTMTLIGGTQVEKAHCNNLLVMHLSNMTQNKPPKENDNEDESEDEEDSDDEDSKPVLEHANIRHSGCVNRVKFTKINDTPVASSWSELGKVFIWDLTVPIKAVNDPHAMASYVQNKESPAPMFTFAGHLTEGYAMEWSPLVTGMLATGDCRKNIHLWKMLEGGSWHVDQRPFTAHSGSVEDIQWSPNEANVMASCSVDKSVRIWDIRVASNKACMLSQNNAHDSDVNVISWNNKDPFILSGGDDGKLRVWDLRRFPGDPICTFKHHTAPITSVEWHPVDHSVFAATGADDQLTQWDLAVERDNEQENESLSPEILALPPQLLFIHQGQKELKELHWHKQMPGLLISTSQSGLNVIRTLSV